MKKFIVLISILICSCASNQGVKLNSYQEDYFLALPDGHIQEKFRGEVYTETRFTYHDGSVFYLTDDIESGGSVNKAKVKEYGNGILVKIAVSDTLDLTGRDDTDKHWREKKIENIVVGYVNAGEGQKRAFDKVIADLR